MFVTQPVIIPMPPPSPARCPNCHDVERKIETCDHCGYKYPKDDSPMPRSIAAWLLILLTAVPGIGAWKGPEWVGMDKAFPSTFSANGYQFTIEDRVVCALGAMVIYFGVSLVLLGIAYAVGALFTREK